MKNPLLTHILVFLVLATLFYLLSEPIAKFIFPDDVEGIGWLLSLGGGIVVIFIGVVISYSFAAGKKRRRR